MMDEDYIRDELQTATAEYIQAIKLAIVRTKEAQRVVSGGRLLPWCYGNMNKIGRFHEDRRFALEAFLHHLESTYSRGMILSIDDWLALQLELVRSIHEDHITKKPT